MKKVVARDDLSMNDWFDEATKYPDPITVQYYRLLKERKLLLSQEVDDTIVETIIVDLLRFDEDGTGKPIEIIIHSAGGSVNDGLVLCNIIDGLKTPTTITVYGYAYSMAMIILMSGRNNPNVKKRCYPFSTGLIHDGSTGIFGNTSKVKDTLEFNNRMEEMIKQYILDNTNITPRLYDSIERKEFYLTSEDMLKYGIVDEIIGTPAGAISHISRKTPRKRTTRRSKD